ncbi:MAG: heparinase II/III family protein, partial [Planctomycetes bacterium]|nr:heparinase II/III family protein [Planctomycetota bacterium]
MAIFLSDQEKQLINEKRGTGSFTDIYWQFINRAQGHASQPGLRDFQSQQDYWHMAYDYISTAAMIYALKPDKTLGGWIRGAVLELARLDDEEWVGPWYRNHTSEPRIGHLETGHLCWACASALDLAADAFSEADRDEIAAKLENTGIRLCREYLPREDHLNNWHCILTAGLAMSAAVLDNREQMDYAAKMFGYGTELFQPDGSYGESLQYSHYAQIGLFLAYESLVRRDPEYAKIISPDKYGRGVRWTAASYFYHKPMDGWGPYPRPRSANFNDSAALFQPPGDLMLHVNVRCRESLPVEAGLARWFFDTCYTGERASEPNDLASFGFYNNAGFLTLPLLAQAGEALAPAEAGMGELEAFSNGDALMRDRLDGKTIVAVYGGCDDLHVKSHRHAALNSGIVVHNRERMLVDPGHSCYRSLIHNMETKTQTHNTVTFDFEDESRHVSLQQSISSQRRAVKDDMSDNLLSREAERLIAKSVDEIRVVGHDAALSYGKPITSAKRFWILCGENSLFVVDMIKAGKPVRATYCWLLNNRDGLLEFKPVPPDRIVARRGNTGMKLFNLGGGNFSGPTYSFVHDCYHPKPQQRGEGASGSGLIVRWSDKTSSAEKTNIHAIALDTYGHVAGWHLRDADASGGRLEYGKQNWECRSEGETV